MYNCQFFVVNNLLSLSILFLLLGFLLPAFGTCLHLHYMTGAATTYLWHPLTFSLHFTIYLAFRHPLTFTTGAVTTYYACFNVHWLHLISFHTTIPSLLLFLILFSFIAYMISFSAPSFIFIHNLQCYINLNLSISF